MESLLSDAQVLALINLDQILEILKLYIANNRGSLQFYNGVQSWVINNSPSISLIRHCELLQIFTKSNSISEEYLKFAVNLLQQIFQISKDDSLESVINQLSPLFSLKFIATQQYHQQFLKYINNYLIQQPILTSELSKNINIFLTTFKINNGVETVSNEFDGIAKFQSVFTTKIRRKTSFFQQEVIEFIQQYISQSKDLLRLRNLEIKIEQQISIYLVDLQVGNTIFECNGRHHYINKQREGQYQIKVNNLQKLGFKIVEVKKSVWEKLRTVREKDEYITYLLSSNHII